jgi:hypothetical protein
MKGEVDLLNLYESRYRSALQGIQKVGEIDDRRDLYRNGPAMVATGGAR